MDWKFLPWLQEYFLFRVPAILCFSHPLSQLRRNHFASRVADAKGIWGDRLVLKHSSKRVVTVTHGQLICRATLLVSALQNSSDKLCLSQGSAVSNAHTGSASRAIEGKQPVAIRAENHLTLSTNHPPPVVSLWIGINQLQRLAATRTNNNSFHHSSPRRPSNRDGHSVMPKGFPNFPAIILAERNRNKDWIRCT